MKILRGIAWALGGVVVALGLVTVLGNTVLKDTPVTDFLQGLGGGAQAGVANAALDASGLKEKAESALRENAGAIAAKTGMSEDQVNAAIDQLDISSWSVTTLPADAQATGSFDTSYGGTAATVTTYADPSYVTVDAAGQSVTLAVPDSAQAYVSYLAYL